MSSDSISIVAIDSRSLRRNGKAVGSLRHLAIGLVVGAAALAPIAVAIAGVLRGGIEPYIVLAALMLG